MFKKSSSHNEQKRVVTTVLTMPYLPDELLLNCLARISRLYYPTLSLISKRFHSLLASTELYRTRRLLGSTENCIYACLLSPHNQPHWCTLGRQPTLIAPFWNQFRILRNRTRMSSSGNLLVSVPSHNFFPDQCPWISTKLVLISTSWLVDTTILSPPLVYLSWTIGFTHGMKLQACW